MNETYDDYEYEYVYYYYFEETCVTCFNVQLRNAMRAVALVFFYLTLILGVPGNAFVVYVAGLKMKRTVNTVGFLNLAIADFFCCLSTLYYVVEHSLKENWPYGSVFVCKILPFIMLINMFASVFTLSLISLDRFTQVLTPVWAQNHRSLFIARLSCAAVWILAAALSLPFMMLRGTLNEYDTKVCLFYMFGNKQMYQNLSVVRFVFGFLVPLVCITTCYGFIACKLGRSQFRSGRAFRIMMAVIVAFFLCWLPYHIVHLILINGDKSVNMAALALDPLAVSLAYFNSCLNPVLYVFMGQDFKSSVKLSLRRVFERVFSEEEAQITQNTHSQQTHSL
ncbi:C3a anaphylatoxin chemotactic receptor-like [Puntigrus tetrazona]|uniref:C3a anaphylatoxin chemotactic receptor-like n=1 Tax=Puntigrus tetrazona TaxID=1606681 RepID=UPI001C89BA0A|nr:C3a anaphylatoxin chemotactic receptor-like [Puntigrus tetrazona]